MKHIITLNELNPDITYSVKDNSVRGIHTAHFDELKIGDKIIIDNYFHEIIAVPDTPANNNDVCTLDLLSDLDAGDYGDRLNDYRDSADYIDDVIHEIADNATSIYYCDILDFVRRNPGSLNDVIAEGLYDPTYNYDFYKHAQCAEYMMIERDIYDHITDALMIVAINYLHYNLHREYIPHELADELRTMCELTDGSDRMSELTTKIYDWLDEYENREFNEFCENCTSCDACPFANCKSTYECRAAFYHARGTTK